MNITTLLYSGLSGTASVAFSLIEADTKGNRHSIVFVGIEDLAEEYAEKCSRLRISFHVIKKSEGLDLKSQTKIYSAIKRTGPDVIILHTLSSLPQVIWYSIFRKTAIISVEHQPNHLKNGKDWCWSFLSLAFSKKIIYLTAAYREQMKKKTGILFRERKVAVVNNGLDLQLFSPKLKKKENDTITLGMLARLVDTKDHVTLIDAVKLLKNKFAGKRRIELQIAGYGPISEQLKKHTKLNGLEGEVLFCGFLNEKESAVFLNGLDIYVHASLGETMSTSIMQAMACKNAIIASDVRGINNMIIGDETGILVPPRNSEAIAAAVETLITNNEFKNRLIENAYRFAVENYSSELMFKRYSQFFINN